MTKCLTKSLPLLLLLAAAVCVGACATTGVAPSSDDVNGAASPTTTYDSPTRTEVQAP